MPRDYRLPGHINFNEGFAGCADRMAILESKLAPRRLADNPDIPVMNVDDISYNVGDGYCDIDNPKSGAYILVDNNGQDMKLPVEKFMYPDHVNADWDAKLENGLMPASYIKNKPNLKVKDMEDAEGNKLYPDGFISEVSYGDILEGDWVDGDATALDILKKMMMHTDRVPLIYGMSTEIPINFQEQSIEYKITGAVDSEGVYQYFEKGGKYPTRQELIRKGATVNFDFRDEDDSPIPGYFFIGVPRGFDLVCFGAFQGGHFIEFDEGWIREPESYDYVIGGTNYRYDFYRLAYPTVGKFTVRFAFMDAFDPRVHPDLRHPGRKMNLSDLWSFLNNIFDYDSEGNPTLKPDKMPPTSSLSDFATWEALTSEGLIREAEDQKLSDLIAGIDTKYQPVKEWKDTHWPDTFGTGREDQPDKDWLPDTVIVGEQYVLKATVQNSRGDVYYRWDRDTSGSEGCDCCDIVNQIRLDGETIVLNSEGEWSADIDTIFNKVVDKLPDFVDDKTIELTSEGQIAIKDNIYTVTEAHESSIVDPIYGTFYYLELDADPEVLYKDINDGKKVSVVASYEHDNKKISFRTVLTSAYKELDQDDNLLSYKFYESIHDSAWQCGPEAVEASDKPRLYL